MTTIDVSKPGQREALLLAWTLLVEDMSYSTFAKLPIPEQVAAALNAGLEPEGLELALRFMSAYHEAHANAFRKWNQSRAESRC